MSLHAGLQWSCFHAHSTTNDCTPSCPWYYMQVDMGMRGHTSDEGIRRYTSVEGIRGIQQAREVLGDTQQVRRVTGGTQQVTGVSGVHNKGKGCVGAYFLRM